MCFAPQRRALFEHQLPKVVRACNVFGILSLRCASPHNSVRFFNISTSKSAPKWCAFIILTAKCASRHNDVHFLTIFWTSKSAPVQTRRAFDILTSTCASATKGCTFWRSELPKVRWQWGVLCIFTAACNFASLISPDGSAPAEPPELQNIGKTVFCDFSTGIFFLLPFSSLIFFLLPVFSLTLPTSAFPSVHIVGSLTSKLHSHILYYKIDPYEVKKTLEISGISKSHAKKGNLRTQETLHDGQLELQQPASIYPANKSSSHCEISTASPKKVTFVAPVVYLFVSTILVQVRYPSRNKMSSRADSKCDRSNASPWQSR